MGRTPEQIWVDNWREAGPELEEIKRQELRAMTPERALFFADAVLSMPWPEDVMARRRAYSGLLEQQDLFRLLRER